MMTFIRVTAAIVWLVAATSAAFYVFYTLMCVSDNWPTSIWLNQNAAKLELAAIAFGLACGILGGIRRLKRARWGLADILAGLPIISLVISFLGLLVAAPS
jgi:hypothetical protein